MTKKRYTVFKSEITGTYVLNDELHKNVFQGVDCAETMLKVAGMLNQQEERIKELENELELYKHYVEFVPSSSDIND